MLEIKSVTSAYGRVTAIRDIDLNVRPGEMVALVGPNGAGKSTLLATIVGLHMPVSGEVVFDGSSIVGLPADRAAAKGIALVPEGRHVFTGLTVGENLMLGGLPQRKNPEAAGDLQRVLERFPILEEYYDKPAGQLSGGEQQQLVIARALLSRPRLLLLDEPSLGLAPKLVDRVFEVLEDLRRDGQTILLVEQNARRAVAVADRSYVLRSGSIVGAGTRQQFADELDISKLYMGESGA